MKITEKKQGNLKLIIAILVVILVSLISFVGIYIKKNGNYKDVIKEYGLAMEFTGNRKIVLKPDETKNSVTKDAEGNVVENATDEDKAKEGYTTEEVPVNDESVLTEENYIESKKVIEKRLKDYKFDEYTIKQDKTNGNIIIELDENADTDSVIQTLVGQGKFEIKDSESKEVLMDNSMIKEAKVLYNTTSTGTVFYINIYFTKEGKEKFEEITTEYATLEKNEESESEETAETEEVEGSDEEEAGEETEETTEEEKQKEIIMEIDGEEILTTSFESPRKDGIMQLTVGQESKDSSTLQKNISQAKNTAVLLSNGKLPVKYASDSNKFYKTDISKECIRKCIIICGIILLGITILFVMKLKGKGLVGIILSIGYIALTLLVLRYTNVEISISGISAIFTMILLNYVLEYMIIKNSIEKEKIKTLKIFGKYIFAILPIFIIALVFSFEANLLLNSFGMILFWGIILSLIYNLIFAKTLFENK